MTTRIEARGGGVDIKYPREDEVVVSPVYRMCVDAPADVEAVYLSINGGPWHVCVHELGYWWYDWLDFQSGEHRLAVRARAKSGRSRFAASRRVIADVLDANLEARLRRPTAAARP